MKEEMVRFDETAIYPFRYSHTVNYPLRQGPEQEQELYDQVTRYCELHFDLAKQNNRSAAGLAMSILQRRLASSTWAILKSLQRRDEKLTQSIQEAEAGLLGEDDLDRRQQRLPTKSVRDTKTGDEEESVDGREESEQEDEAIAGATDARTLNELIAERDEVRHLARLARRVYEQRQESKFERLWQAMADHLQEKVLIFTEFRDTLDFLADRLEGKGLTGKIAYIHGGMSYPERDQQAQFFRNEARVMVATDAAGEGINLQFCWLLVNYDIPWNPARLEQRMGRVHRYKQQHNVVLLNMVSQNTREGRVLKVLLDKLEDIRQELGSDKVFDIIGQQFTGKSLSDLIFEAALQGKEAQATQEFTGLTKEKTYSTG
jgi:SNF2 family DNA or RNA helicase